LAKTLTLNSSLRLLRGFLNDGEEKANESADPV